MSQSSPPPGFPAYPDPQFVVGVGRFGLAVLEEVAETWGWFDRTGADPTIRNLHLFHVASSAGDGELDWRELEKRHLKLAEHAHHGDVPSRAVDLAILRSLGLVRIHDGTYEVGIPEDHGTGEYESGTAGKEADRHLHTYRRRCFRWVQLAPDPLVSADRLHDLKHRMAELDLFVSPILNRVRQGRAPHVLLLGISRMRAWADGRDPSPWRWVHERLAGTSLAEPPHLDISKELKLDGDALVLELHLKAFMADPLDDAWANHRADCLDRKEGSGASPQSEQSKLPKIALPQVAVPLDRDLPSPVDVMELLKVDWATTGWASAQHGPEDVRFELPPYSPFRLGLFDHDSTYPRGGERQIALSDRLKMLGKELHRGLSRLWIDLARSRGGGEDPFVQIAGVAEGVDESVQQSLELLGELLVRRVADSDEDVVELHVDWTTVQKREKRETDTVLPDRPSASLRSLVFESTEAHNEIRAQLENRLSALGLGHPTERSSPVRLLDEIALGVEDVRRPVQPKGPSPGMLRLREKLNQAVHRVYHIDYLRQYRVQETRRPPRLTVFVLADMGDPFARCVTKEATRELHAELHRCLGPIFDDYTSGVNRSLVIIPILSMPHPADAFGGAHLVQNRYEEASILEAVHGFRRWVDGIPQGTRAIPQLFVNGRVTDNATLSLNDAVEQTRDFLSLCMHHRIGQDPFLTTVVCGTADASSFSTFACYTLDAPTRRCREYMASRLGRSGLECIVEGQPECEHPAIESGVEIPDGAALAAAPEGEMCKRLEQKANELSGHVTSLGEPFAKETSPDEMLRTYSPEFLVGLKRQIVAVLRDAERSGGVMDQQIDRVRRDTTGSWLESDRRLQHNSNRYVRKHLVQAGLRRLLVAFKTQSAQFNNHLSGKERSRRDQEREVSRQRSLDDAGVTAAHTWLTGAIEEKPEWKPIEFGHRYALFLAVGYSLPIALFIVGTLDGARMSPLVRVPIITAATGFLALGLWLLTKWLLGRHVKEILEKIQAAVDGLARATVQVVVGEQGPTVSIFSFMKARLHLATALATKGFAQLVAERSLRDGWLVTRMLRSVEAQRLSLTRYAEELGVRPALQPRLRSASGEDDIRDLFSPRTGRDAVHLIKVEQVQEAYDNQFPNPQSLQHALGGMIQASDGFENWRGQALLADTDRILEYGRGVFSEVVTEPQIALPDFDAVAADRIVHFVRQYYANTGFGAEFTGRKGLDPQGIVLTADNTLVYPESMQPHITSAEKLDSSTRSGEGKKGNLLNMMSMLRVKVNPGRVYLTSIAQGIAGHCIANLMRYESFLQRAYMPDGSSFPLTGDFSDAQSVKPVNRLHGQDELKAEFFDAAQYGDAPSARSTKSAISKQPSAPAAPDVSPQSPAVEGESDA